MMCGAMANGIAQRDTEGAVRGMTARSARPDKKVRLQDDAVWWVKSEIKCRACGTKVGKNDFLQKKAKRWLCLACAGLAHLTFLPRGDVALTRRATKHSSLHAIVVRRVRGRLERKGMLVEAEALQRATQECQADAPVREQARVKAAVRRAIIDERYVREFTKRLGQLFPGCPADERKSIAEHTCEKYSGRIGRSAAAVRFDAEAIRVAVHAHIRHNHTRYDELLKNGKTRKRARNAVHKAVKQVAERWRSKGS
jgi:hypothetical protein